MEEITTLFTDQTSMEKEITLVLPDPEAILHPIATLTAKPVTFTLDMELMRRLHNRDLSG